MRKSFSAVTACGSSDFGSAICATTRTPGGVSAAAGPPPHAAAARARTASTGTAIVARRKRAGIAFLLSAPPAVGNPTRRKYGSFGQAPAPPPVPSKSVARGIPGPSPPPESGVQHHQDGQQLQPAEQHRERSEEHTSELQSLMRISYAV